MEELTVEELKALPEGTVVYDNSNEKLWRTDRGWRFSEIEEDGSYLETISVTAIMLWGPMTLEPKGSEWETNKALESTQDLIEGLTVVWEEADRNTQNMMIEMIRSWYLERAETKLL